MALTTVVALALLVVLAQDIWSQVDGSPTLGLLGTVWPALLAGLVAAAVVALAGFRADRAWLLPAGALLVGVVATSAVHALAGTWWGLRSISDLDQHGAAFLVGGVKVTPSSAAWDAAWEAAAILVGPALCVIGALRASRDTPPETA